MKHLPSSPACHSLLIVDDDEGFVAAAGEIARQQRFDPSIATTVAEAIALLQGATFDLVLIDLALPDGSGMELLDYVDLATTQTVLVSGQPTLESALQAVRLPVVDYIVKPLLPERYLELLAQAAQRRPPARSDDHWNEMAGGEALLAIKDQVRRVARTDASVLIVGESGTGKELVARALHSESGRKGPLIAVNSGAVAPELLASQLFGHEKGSFTGAHTRQAGFFEQAEGGTLFLDEITEMPLHLQAHLLRVLESRTVRRLGGQSDVPINVRMIAATNRQPKQAIADGRLREDVFYRLGEFPLTLPPLRERPEDVAILATAFLARLNQRYGTARTFARDAIERLQRHRWPGNIRELRNQVQRAYIMADSNTVEVPLDAHDAREPLVEDAQSVVFRVGMRMDEIERRVLLKTLAWCDNNKARAAQMLGITAKTIYNRLAQYGQQDDEEKQDDPASPTPP
ncbi:MAG TPA: sigma-54 dependent transcriptional regulator [Xanthomonadaceae bacterium]|jgi:DNA-binding NtrC family response regulator